MRLSVLDEVLGLSRLAVSELSIVAAEGDDDFEPNKTSLDFELELDFFFLTTTINDQIKPNRLGATNFLSFLNFNEELGLYSYSDITHAINKNDENITE